VTKSKLSMQLQ